MVEPGLMIPLRTPFQDWPAHKSTNPAKIHVFLPHYITRRSVLVKQGQRHSFPGMPGEHQKPITALPGRYRKPTRFFFLLFWPYVVCPNSFSKYRGPDRRSQALFLFYFFEISKSFFLFSLFSLQNIHESLKSCNHLLTACGNQLGFKQQGGNT